MHLLFTPNHVQLLISCYPPTSALLTVGPEFSPNSHELSRLTYYASNNPGKLTKLGSELEKRSKSECRKARAGNIRSRASLLITLTIFKALATECRRDIVLLSSSLITSVNAILDAVSTDLEVVARAASVFTTWTTYTDGHLIGADSNLTKDYLFLLRKFSSLSGSEPNDDETRNRTRLVGLAALTGAVNSEALYNDSQQFRFQVSTILHPVLIVLFQVDLATLDDQALGVKDAPVSPYLSEFRTRPAIERRAASIHVHRDGDKGPSPADVSDACLRILFSLISHANGMQLGYIMQASFDNLDDCNGWSHPDHCCWFALKSAEWAQYQYRYVVPTWLVERLIVNQTAIITPLHSALANMITTVFNSPIPFVNLSSSDIMSNLMGLLLRRTSGNYEDPLLPSITECIASLGKHVYYSDQILDLAVELINRLIVVEVQGVVSRGKSGFAQTRTWAICHLLAGLRGLIRTANKNQANLESTEALATLSPSSSTHTNKTREPGVDTRASRRTRVPPDIWQDTLSLLCDEDEKVRSEYTDALVFYLLEEMPNLGDGIENDVLRRSGKPADRSNRHAGHRNIPQISGDVTNRFFNATHAYLYLVATSTRFGLSSLSADISSRGVSTTDSELQGSDFQPNGRRSLSTPHPRSQKTILAQQLIKSAPKDLSATPAASFADYKRILKVLTTVQERSPICGLFGGIPMLLSLSAICKYQDEDIPSQRIIVIRELIARVWLKIGQVWNATNLVNLVEEALSSLPGRSVIFNDKATNLAGKATTWAGISGDVALSALIANQVVQEATHLDQDGLCRRFTLKWTPELAVNESERSFNYDASFKGDGVSPLFKLSPALMHIENISRQSLARSIRGLGVTDLREALEGRSSMSNPALVKPPSISTLDHESSITSGDLRLTQTRSRSRVKRLVVPSGSGEVRDVLTRLGISKQSGNLLKSSFPALHKPDQSAPPYKV